MSATQSMSNAEVRETILSILREVDRSGMENLIDYLCNKSDYFTAPASTRYHLSEEGGLARHSLNVYYELLALVQDRQRMTQLWPDQEYATVLESIKVIALLHDLCKCSFYTVSYRNVKNEQGQWEKVPYYTIEDSFPMGHGEKSMYIASCYIKLTRDEAMAIRWHMGPEDEAVRGGSKAMGNAYNKHPLAVLTYAADMFAAYLDESEKKGGA